MRTKEQPVKTFKAKEVAGVCDHTFLKRSEGYKADTKIGESCVRLREHEFFRFLEYACLADLKPYAVCVRAEDVPHAYRFMEKYQAEIPIVATVGFPDGHWYHHNFKLFEAQFAVSEGAAEVDMVINYQALKEGSHSIVLQEVQTIAKAVHRQEGKIKLIIETSELTNPQVIQACRIATHAGVDFVKTSTGFGAYGVQPEQFELICSHFQGGIKISGGVSIDNLDLYLSLLNKARGGGLQLRPETFRIGESSLLQQLEAAQKNKSS